MDTPHSLALEFNQVVNGLLRRVEQKSRSDQELANLDRVQKRITLLKQTLGLEALIEIAAPIIVQYSSPIMSNNEEEFLGMNMREEALARGVNIENGDEYVFELIESVKAHYRKLDAANKKTIFVEVNKLLNFSARFLKLAKITKNNEK